MEIAIDSRQTRIALDLEAFRNRTEKALELSGCRPSAAISVALVGSDEMADLNRRYRGKAGPTNVLSFSQREGEQVDGDSDLLGDVVVCADVASEDAAKLGYTEEEMIVYLVIHGILHLVGYDHSDPLDAEAMQSRVESIFQELMPAAGSVSP